MLRSEPLNSKLPKRAILGLLLCLTGFACGYRVASANRTPPDIRSVAVLPLQNATFTYEVEQILTRSLVRTFIDKTPYRVVGEEERADAVLTGVIARLSASPVTFGTGSFGTTFLVTLTVALELRDRRTNEVLFKEDRYIFREQYVISTDVENFFSELNPALERVADDFAASVVTTVLEKF